MNFPAHLFPDGWLFAANGLLLLIVSVSLWRVPWRQLSANVVGVWMAATVLLAVMWQVKAGVQAGLSFHLLGGTLFALLMGSALALPALALVLLFLVVAGQMDLMAVGVNFCLTMWPAVLMTGLMLRLARRFLQAHFFVYIFVNAFLAAALSMLLSAMTGMGALWWLAVYDTAYLLDNALPFYFLLSWSEAFTTGLLLSIMVVYRPHWVQSFDDARYLNPSS